MSTDRIPSTTDDYLTTDQNQSSSAVKFGLFIKTREMKQIESSLREVMLLPADKRTEWLENNEEMINDMLETFVNDSALALDGLHLDPEALQMSMEYVTTLRDLMTTMRSILDDSRKLNS